MWAKDKASVSCAVSGSKQSQHQTALTSRITVMHHFNCMKYSQDLWPQIVKS